MTICSLNAEARYENMLGDFLKLLRKSEALSMTELAKMLDLSAAYISLVENGKREPTLSLLRKYSNHFGISLPAMFTIMEENFSESNGKLFLRILEERVAEEDERNGICRDNNEKVLLSQLLDKEQSLTPVLRRPRVHELILKRSTRS